MFIKLLHALLALRWFLPYSINEMTLGLKTSAVVASNYGPEAALELLRADCS